jgi:hypothetical protein
METVEKKKENKKIKAGIFSKKFKKQIRENKGKIIIAVLSTIVFNIFYFLFFMFVVNADNKNIITTTNTKKVYNFSHKDEYNKYKESFEYYKYKATADELLYSFIELISEYKYKLGGKWNNKQTDCTGAVNLFFKKWGANFALENVKGITRRIKKLRQKSALEKRIYIRRVRRGDIIILSKNGVPSHIGIVYKVTPSGRIQYFDMNSLNRSWGLNTITMHNKKIVGIYEVSFELWLGNFKEK